MKNKHQKRGKHTRKSETSDIVSRIGVDGKVRRGVVIVSSGTIQEGTPDHVPGACWWEGPLDG
jgi:hypothetical protein